MCGEQSRKVQNFGVDFEMVRMTSPVRSVCFSPSNTILAVASEADELSLVDVEANGADMRKKVCSLP